jgi:moderate conductance mechanosensitive channel
MGTTNLPAETTLLDTNATFVRQIIHHFGHESSTGTRLVLIILVALLAHLTVRAVRHLSEWLIRKGRAKENPLGFVTQQPKFVTFIHLIASSTTFIMYFFALGLVLQELLHFDLTTYLASASIVALAISFGSQGLVQDVVIGLTLIFSDAMDVGDLVEVYGGTTVIGRVEEIGLRFTKIRNFFNQEVFVPNRNIANVSRFPDGGVFAYADIQFPADADRERAAQAIRNVAQGMWAQFGAIILSEPVVGPVETAAGGGWNFVRVQFKIWPGQGNLIETTFRQQIVTFMKGFSPNYADWQVPVTYRALTATKQVQPRLASSPAEPPV